MFLNSPTTVLGIFEDAAHASKAITALKEAGFTDQQIGVASRQWSKPLDKVRLDEQHTAEQGAIGGAIVGGGLGAAIGLIGAALVPGVIPVVAGGTLVAALLGGAAGAAGGAYAGPFIALGFTESEAKEHAEHIQQGKTVLFVYAPERKDEARRIMVSEGAYDEAMASSP